MVQIWDVSANRLVLAYHGHLTNTTIWTVLSRRGTAGRMLPQRVRTVSWSPDGRRIASSDSESVQVWDAASGATLVSFETSLTFRRGTQIIPDLLAWNPANTRLALGGTRGLAVWTPGSP